jgi:hypothetical protein
MNGARKIFMGTTMDRTEQDIIDDLFDKLAQAERADRNHDTGAERHIAKRIDRQPAAPYYMAQAILIQEHALKQAQARIEELESELSEAPAQQGGGGFLGGIFGGGAQQQPRGSVPRSGGMNAGSRYPSRHRNAQEESPVGQYGRTGQGGGFLAGAATTAAGVAGGMLIGSMLGGMFGGDSANAAEASQTNNAEQGSQDNAAQEADNDGGGWFGGGDGGDFDM